MKLTKKYLRQLINEVINEAIKKGKLPTGVTEFNVTATGFKRKTHKSIGTRTEAINISTNKLFQQCKTYEDIENKYESFWNDLNPNSEEVVRVSNIQPKT